MARFIMAITAILQLICGSVTIDLLDRNSGLLLKSWRPAIAPVKDGGIWQNSPLANGRRLAQAKRDNIIDTFTFDARSGAQDATIQTMQDLRRWLELAQNYWVTGDPSVQPDVPYIKAQAANETNTRYSLVYRGDCLEDGEPYAQPFFGIGCRSAMTGLTLALEHGDWTDMPPGTSTCVQVAGTGTGNDLVTVTASPAQSEDDAWCYAGGASFSLTGTALPLGYFTAGSGIAGVRFPNVVVPQGATIVEAYITFYADFSDANEDCRVQVRVQEADNPAIFSTYADFAARLAPRPAYPVLQWPDPNWGTTIERWTADSTYTTRNDCPLIRMQVQALVDRPGWAAGNAMAFFFIDNGSDPTPAVRRASSWDHADPDTPPELTIIYIDDSSTTGRTATCDDEVYVANKQNDAALTHIFWNSGANWSGNLIGAALPFELFDNPMANGDYLYFGIATTDPLTSGPFSSLVFDIGTPAVYTAAATITWEYYNGGWVALTARDNTASEPRLTRDPFVQDGVNSVHWLQPSDWAAVAINGVTAYWVRAVVNIGAGDAITTPTQQNRDVYTVTWPYVDIAATQVAGDMPALARIYRSNESGYHLGPDIGFDRLMIGLRSASRGLRYTPYINLSQEQNDAGVTVSVGANSAFTADPSAPTGWNVTFTSAGATGLTQEITVNFADDLMPEYHGTYRVFLRAMQEVATTVGQVELRLEYRFPGGRPIYTPWTPFNYVNCREPVDFGRVTIPTTALLPTEESTGSLIRVNVRWTAAGVSIYFYDLILFPVDEWAGSFDWVQDFPYVECRYISNPRYVDIDSIGNPRSFLRAVLHDGLPGASIGAVGSERVVANGPAIMQANRAQRLWFFSSRLGGAGTYNLISDNEESGRVQAFRQQRYFSSRGSR